LKSCLTKYDRAFKVLEDEGTAVAPPKRTTHPALSSAIVPPVEAVSPATVSPAEAVPALLSATVSPAEAIPAIPAPIVSSAEAVAAISSPTVSPAEPVPANDLEDIHPQGSSRATGGFMRHRAAASYYSRADEENTMFNVIGTAKLTAKIYTSDLDPLNLNHDNMVPSSKVTVKMNPYLGPILDNISQRYPAIKGIF
jgi:hypothetical protein